MTSNPLKANDNRPAKRSKAEWVEYANQHAWSIGRTDIEWYIDKAGEIQIGRPMPQKRIAAA